MPKIDEKKEELFQLLAASYEDKEEEEYESCLDVINFLEIIKKDTRTYTMLSLARARPHEDKKEVTRIDEKIEKLRPRLKSTLRRLQQRGLYWNSIDVMFQDMPEDCELPNWILSIYCMATKRVQRLIDTPITDDTWFFAIESIVRKYKPDAICDDSYSNYSIILKGHEEELLQFVFAIHFMDIPRLFELSKDNTSPKSLDADKSVKRLQKKYDEQAKEVKRLNTARDDLSRQIHDLKKQLSEERLAHSKDILRVEHEHDDEIEALHNEIAKLQRHISRLEAKDDDSIPVSMEGEDDAETSEAESSQPDTTSPEDDFELPESNVIFLGGHIGVIQKLRAIHPNWTYYNCKEFRSYNFPQETKVVFYHFEHTSHKAGDIVFSRTRGAEPVYVTATNIPLLEQEMKKGYRELLRQQEEQQKR